MADKKNQDSDTIRQQRKAREEFLALKRMQSGDAPAPPPPSADAVSPKTLREKSQNFWFYHRFTVIGTIFLAIVLAVGITQCLSREDYDLTINLYISTQITDTQANKMAKYFEKFAEDTNGDGQTKVFVVNCSYTEGINKQIEQANATKIQASLISEPDNMLFILDDITLKRLNSIPATTRLFSDEGVAFGEKFYESTKNEAGSEAPKGLKIIRRSISNTTMQDNKDAARSYKSAGKFLKKLKNDNP